MPEQRSIARFSLIGRLGTSATSRSRTSTLVIAGGLSSSDRKNLALVTGGTSDSDFAGGLSLEGRRQQSRWTCKIERRFCDVGDRRAGPPCEDWLLLHEKTLAAICVLNKILWLCLPFCRCAWDLRQQQQEVGFERTYIGHQQKQATAKVAAATAELLDYSSNNSENSSSSSESRGLGLRSTIRRGLSLGRAEGKSSRRLRRDSRWTLGFASRTP